MTKERLEEIKKIYPPFEGREYKHQTIRDGDIFNQWTVLYRTQNRPKNKRPHFVCECECGNIKVVTGDHLRAGQSKGCGKGACKTKSRILNQVNKEKKKKETKFYIYKYVENNKIIYIGKSKNLKVRIQQHTRDKLKNFKGNIYYFTCETETDMKFLEYVLINKYHPKENLQLKNIDIQTDLVEPKWILYKEEDFK